jgi:hypothetical protein
MSNPLKDLMNMKFSRNILIAASALVLACTTSCNSTPEGKGDATIGFASDSYLYKETAGLVKLPVQFTGEPKTYPITFDIVATVQGSDDAVETLVHFTQTKGLKYAGIEGVQAYIEFTVYDNRDINDSKFIQLQIANVKGATVEGNGKTVIEIADNDNNPYERLWGNWTLKGTNVFDGTTATCPVNISGGFSAAEEAVNADRKLVCWGFGGEQVDLTGSEYSPIKQPVWYLSYNAEAQRLALIPGEVMANIYDFSQSGIAGSSFEIKTAALYADSQGLVYDYEYKGVTATWSSDMNTITFAPNTGIYATIWGDGADTGYGFAGYLNITMTRN